MPDKTNFGIADINLENDLKDLKNEFIFMLLEYYKIYKEEGLQQPDQIRQDSLSYRVENDIVLQFINDKCQLEKGNRELRAFAIDLFREFEQWRRDEDITQKITKVKFYLRINSITGYDKEKKISIGNDSSRGWYGICLSD